MNEQDLSKPGPLVSSCQDLDCPTGLAIVSKDTPYSGDSGRLEISKSLTGAETITDPLLCEEVGGALHLGNELISHNEPEENTYLSSCPSSLENPMENTYLSSCPSLLENQEVLHHELHLSEDASIQNNDGQTLSLRGHLSPEAHQDQAEACLGNTVSNLDGSQIPGLNRRLNGTSTCPPPATGTRVNCSSNDHHVLEHVRSEVNPSAMIEASGVPELKLEQEEGGARVTWAGIYPLLGAIGVAVLFIAWRMKK
ncbi:hypothetical protein UPYG_G00228610 [Umbra pygmaea]|uniref:Uncharacterized protein n=1 Tax=Umbra pygmaea TaxID=75934 RepID=A0ABD0X3H7_UMBPY